MDIFNMYRSDKLFRPDITVMVGWTLKNQLSIYADGVSWNHKLCTAYVNPFDTLFYGYAGVDNTYYFDAVESLLLENIDTVCGSKIILCGDFNARTADRSRMQIVW